MSRVICISTHKGGVGKTTTAINVSAAFAMNGLKTLLIDIDPQGHASLGLGLDVAYDDPNIADVLKDNGLNMEDTIFEVSKNLFLAPSNIRLASVAEAMYSKFRREERLKKKLNPILRDFDRIIIDCPPSLGLLVANAITVSDTIIVPCQMGARSLDGLDDLLDLAKILKDDFFDSWFILLTAVDIRKRITYDAFMKIIEPHKEQGKVLHTHIRVNESLNQAQFAGESIFQFDPKSRGAEDYLALANEFL